MMRFFIVLCAISMSSVTEPFAYAQDIRIKESSYHWYRDALNDHTQDIKQDISYMREDIQSMGNTIATCHALHDSFMRMSKDFVQMICIIGKEKRQMAGSLPLSFQWVMQYIDLQEKRYIAFETYEDMRRMLDWYTIVQKNIQLSHLQRQIDTLKGSFRRQKIWYEQFALAARQLIHELLCDETREVEIHLRKADMIANDVANYTRMLQTITQDMQVLELAFISLKQSAQMISTWELTSCMRYCQWLRMTI